MYVLLLYCYFLFSRHGRVHAQWGCAKLHGVGRERLCGGEVSWFGAMKKFFCVILKCNILKIFLKKSNLLFHFKYIKQDKEAKILVTGNVPGNVATMKEFSF